MFFWPFFSCFFLYFSFLSFLICFFFFFFFEFSLFPTLFLILGWGMNIERIQSGFYLFFYTLFSSLPMLFSIFSFLWFGFSLSFFYLSFLKFNILYLFFVFSFLVKMPMFLVHSWLPKAHVEAPVYGSMILAGVLLKMGGYGIFRFSYFFKFFWEMNMIWIYVSVWGSIVSSMVCVRQNDLKCLIAFSSVSHMSLVIMGLFMMNKVSVLGCFYMMIGHGFCSSGLFYMVNLIYLRSGTRNMILNKGLLSCFPSFSMWWFLFCVVNLGCPPSLNLFGELFLMISSLSWSFSFFFFFMVVSFMGAVYNLFMYSFISHGNPNSNFLFLSPLLIREYFLISFHFFPIIFFFLKIDIL